MESRVEWVVEWFPPEGDQRHTFKDEPAMRRFITKDSVSPWNPLVSFREIVVTEVVMPEFVQTHSASHNHTRFSYDSRYYIDGCRVGMKAQMTGVPEGRER